MGERTEKFAEKLAGLREFAKKKKNVLEPQEIFDYFQPENLDAEQLDQVYEFLDAHHIDILPTLEGDLDEVLLNEEELEQEEEIDVENIDLSVPEGVSLEDPVRMYLKEIGKCRFCPWKKK